MRDMIETAAISDAELDAVSGGLGASLPGDVASVDVTPSAGGVSLSASGTLPGMAGLSGNLSGGFPHTMSTGNVVG